MIAAHRYPQDADRAERAPYAAWVAGAMGRGLYLGFVLEQEGAVVAGAGLTLLEWGPSRHDPQPWRARLVNVWTHPDWRRQGHARALVQACLGAAQARGITRISLGTSEMGRRLYGSLGFTDRGGEMLLVLGDSTAD
ncbi:GNAT family N-acetyltransferase [Deinococcus aquaedulcis]|uniref:GNAT family N-acetyltransferase n=1 Tax=Deinococcus aquaedulcis TaxID=2840455 RepID=UPI001C82BDE7|nr:GNAT family N-acetyltransferase [Deinococcus aquaedulcis]